MSGVSSIASPTLYVYCTSPTCKTCCKLQFPKRAEIMLSGGRSQFVALKAKMPWLDINQERHHGYAGYEGMVKLVEEIDKALHNPVWQQVRAPAPWDETEEGN